MIFLERSEERRVGIESVVEERSKDVLILNQQKDFISHFYK